MSTISVEVDNSTYNYILKNHKSTKSYLSNLIKEDILLNQIKESKNSGINYLTNLDDLDK